MNSLLNNIRRGFQKKVRPTSFLGFFVYNIYYNMFTFYKQFYFYYPKKNYYMGHLFVYFKKNYKFHLSCKSAVTFIYEMYIKDFYLSDVNLNNDDYVLDIGANAGLFSVKISEMIGKNGKLVCFEPSKKNITNIHKNFKYNDVSNAVIVGKGTFCRKDEFEFYEYEQDFCNSIYKIEHGDLKIKKKTKIEVDRVDSVLKSINFDVSKIRFVKIDNEGAEFETLKGMGNILDMKNLQVLIPDLKPKDDIYNHVIKYLLEKGFKINKKLLPIILAKK